MGNNLKIAQFGRSLAKLFPNLNQQPKYFGDVFSIKRPQCEIIDNTTFSGLLSQLVIIESLEENAIALRGQFKKYGNNFLFVGSPWFFSTEQVASRNLKMHDFAIHDPLVDLLFLLKTQENSNADLKDMVLKITEQRENLIRDKKEIKKLSQVASANNDKLKESENRLASLIVNLQSGVLLEDESRKILLVNNRFCSMFDIPLATEDLIGYDCTNSAEQVKTMFKNPDEFISRIDEILIKKEVTDEVLELEDGRYYERRYVPIIIDGNYRGNLWSYDDITLKKTYNESITHEKEKYRSIIDNMNIGLLEVDNSDRILLANQRFSQMSGYSIDFLIGKKGADLFLDENEKAKIENKRLERRMGVSDSYELTVRNKDNEERLWLVSGAPNYNLKGEVVGSIGLHFDITEIKKLENQKMQLLETLEKQNEQLLDYAHVVSHDLKSPLRSIHSLITFIKEDTDAVFNDKTIKYFNLIQEKAEKMDYLIQGVLTYSKIENISMIKERIDINDLISNVRKIIFIPSHIQIIVESRLPVIHNELFKMQQLFQNLISNAIQYNDKPNGLITISFEEFKTHYVFAIEDNGIGIAKADQRKIFDMFQTLHSDHKSTGIGLSIVRRILKNANERIWLKSREGIGTTFYFTLHK